ncbi:uncharacterized protein VTP21DRAFT_11162 [Calcarisporiella thermophila]|uniref:uncharacterized protein n=1 Tax=Calcarisporiella thermophila TaxID=911321 RepID=UPI0037422904
MTYALETAVYGKDRVRLLKVVRKGKWHEVTELTVRVMLEGDIATSYTKADNSIVVATDSMKNTVYIKAKEAASVQPFEHFACDLAHHFVSTYSHIHQCHIDITQHRWNRLLVHGEIHPHAFSKESDVDTTQVTYKRNGGYTIRSGLKDLCVLKSTGSSFTNFVRDKYTTLPEAEDRVFSTVVESKWEYPTTHHPKEYNFELARQEVRRLTLEAFVEPSPSVQATLYNTAHRFLDSCKDVARIYFAMPNVHYFPVNLKPFGMENEGASATVYQPLSDPSGLITATLSRSDRAKL